MEFREKLQELRRQRGITQEELAEKLYVSRTAVSKWESGRGYPNIDSLKAIAAFFEITVDELLTGGEALTLAEHDGHRKEAHFRDLTFGLLDIGTCIIIFLPLFAQRVNGTIQDVSLLSLTETSAYLRIAYLVVTFAMIGLGITTLALQNCEKAWWVKAKHLLSLCINAVAVLLFTVSLQPYAAALVFTFLAIKTILMIKRR